MDTKRRSYDIYDIEERVHALELGGGNTPTEIKGTISEIVKETTTEIRDGSTHTINVTKKYTNPYVVAANAQPLSDWGGIMCVRNVVYSSTNNTITFTTYTNYDATKSQNYNVDWLIFEEPDAPAQTTSAKTTKRSKK